MNKILKKQEGNLRIKKVMGLMNSQINYMPSQIMIEQII